MSLRGMLLGLSLMAVSLPGVVQAEATQDFKLTNATGYTIDKVFVSPSSQESWESDVLGQDVLGDGEGVNIHFDRDTSTCSWDLKVVYTDYNEAVFWRGIDLCSVSAITIHWNQKTDETSAEFN